MRTPISLAGATRSPGSLPGARVGIFALLELAIVVSSVALLDVFGREHPRVRCRRGRHLEVRRNS